MVDDAGEVGIITFSYQVVQLIEFINLTFLI